MLLVWKCFRILFTCQANFHTMHSTSFTFLYVCSPVSTYAPQFCSVYQPPEEHDLVELEGEVRLMNSDASTSATVS